MRLLVSNVVWFVFLSLSAIAGGFEATAVKACAAYDNLKHSRNTRDIHLHKDYRYRLVEARGSDYLVKVPRAYPIYRWVDKGCFGQKTRVFTSRKRIDRERVSGNYYDSGSRAKRGYNLLVLNWHNAFCELNPYKAECRIGIDGSDPGHLSLHGLWPQPRNRLYCNVPHKIIARDKHHQWKYLPDPAIDTETSKLMSRYMPGYRGYLHRHEWIKHGTCYGTGPEEYFADAFSLASQVDRSEVGRVLREHIGRTITLYQIRKAFDRSFGRGAGKRVEMRCKNGLLSELWINTSGHGDDLSSLIHAAPSRRSRCQRAIVDPKGISGRYR